MSPRYVYCFTILDIQKFGLILIYGVVLIIILIIANWYKFSVSLYTASFYDIKCIWHSNVKE